MKSRISVIMSALALVLALQTTAAPQRAADRPKSEDRRKIGSRTPRRAPVGVPKEAGGQNETASSDAGKTQAASQPQAKTANSEAKPEQKAAQGTSSDVRAYDEGDTVRFEKKTPFGVARWTRKKSELDESERAILAQQQAKPAGAARGKQ